MNIRLAIIRETAVQSIMREYPDFTDVTFSCDTCAQNETCEYAFDEMNIGDECLLNK